jgi:hypothetical protein
VHARYTCATCRDTFGVEEEFAAHNLKMHPELHRSPR